MGMRWRMGLQAGNERLGGTGLDQRSSQEQRPCCVWGCKARAGARAQGQGRSAELAATPAAFLPSHFKF